MPKLKDALKNEKVKSLIFLAIVLGGIVIFWFGVKAYLRTEYPMLAVASPSMVPTLKVGDLIIVQGGLNVSDIYAAYGTGDIIVFRSPASPGELIVHRAVAIEGDGLKTRGDNNPSNDYWTVFDSNLVGKVVGVIPYIGYIPLEIHKPYGIMIIVTLLIILVLLEFAIPIVKERRAQEEPKEENEVLDV